MSSSPNFATTARHECAQVSVANANRDGTGTLATVFNAGASGSRISRIHIKATVTTTAGIVRLYIHDGTNARLWNEVAVTAITPSATVKSFSDELSEAADYDTLPIMLKTGESLRASTEKAETFNVHVFGGDF